MSAVATGTDRAPNVGDLVHVDRNPMAVDLAKVSLWLVTLAKDHPLTFIDHALRHGDSLVGLSRQQLAAFRWDSSRPPPLPGLGMRDAADRVTALRRRIRAADESVADWTLRDWWEQSEAALGEARLCGDLAVAAFFEGSRPKQREERRRATGVGSTSGATRSFRWRRSTGRSSSRRCSIASRRASMRSSAIRRSPARTRWRRPTLRGTRTGSSRSMPRATATPTWWRTSSGARSI